MTVWIVCAVACIVALAGLLAFVYECVTAPTLDAYGNVIADPYGRIGPKFEHGDPVPECHHGKKWL